MGSLNKIFLFFLFGIFFINLISAVPPITTIQQFSAGYDIQIPQDNILQVGQSYSFRFHVFNISDGTPVSNGIGCNFHLYNSTGDRIYVGTNSTPNGFNVFSFWIDGGNFSAPAHDYYYITCNSSSLGGFSQSILIVDQYGTEFTVGQSILYVVFILGSLFMFMFTLMLAIKLPYSNKKSEDGKVVGINNLKYPKIGLFVISYVMLMFVMGLLRGITANYIPEIGVHLYFEWIFWVMFSLLWPLIIVALVIMIVNHSNDKKITKYTNLGGGNK